MQGPGCEGGSAMPSWCRGSVSWVEEVSMEEYWLEAQFYHILAGISEASDVISPRLSFLVYYIELFLFSQSCYMDKMICYISKHIYPGA